MKTKTFSFITGLFFALLILFLFSYLFLLRNQNEIRAQMSFSEITSEYENLTRGNDPQPFFQILETRHPTLLGFLVLQNGAPETFWGNENLVKDDNELLRLVAPEVTQVLLTRHLDPGISTSAVFRVLGNREFFLVSRAGLVTIVVFFVLSLLGFWTSKAKLPRPRPQPKTDTNTVPNEVYKSSPDPRPIIQKEQELQPKAVVVSEVQIEDPKSNMLVYPLDALEDRLAGELHRAGSNQMDVSLGLISSDLDDETELQSLLREHFLYKDVLFRESTRSCWVILPQMDLDLGIAEVERFMSIIRRRYATGGDGRNPRKPPSFTCGLSSRNGRIMAAARLIKEARQAHKKTGPEAMVIGFRTNSEQYRKFILRKQS